jgi:hypothetical protein
MLRELPIVAFFFFLVHYAVAQDIPGEIEKSIVLQETEAHLGFLASDEMRGRNVGTPELNIAADYIRTHFRANGIKPAPGTHNYYQPVEFSVYESPLSATALIGNEQFLLKENLLVLNGGSVNWSGEFVYVGYGSSEDLKRVDIKGKMVLALAGSREADDINKVYRASREKYDLIKKEGAVGLVELLTFSQVPWPGLVNFFNKSKWSLNEEGNEIPFVWVKPKNLADLSLKTKKKVSGALVIEIDKPKLVMSQNVAGIIEGTDPALKNEYVIFTSHYDHIGVDASQKGDSIFNGARDNANGTVAMMQIAKFLAAFPPKRSVVFIALTAEEKGTLGSQWYVKHPLIPLNKTVLNFNSDGLGYNDKSMITSISLGRTNMDGFLLQAAKRFNFTLGGDPDAREGFYERSDQVSFAKVGIPAIKLQPGFSEMNDEILRYYHRAQDEVESMDLDYITRFYRAFVYAAHLITNDSLKPAWVNGDKFEAEYKKLYQQ